MLESLEPCDLLRFRLWSKQEQDHDTALSRNAIAPPFMTEGQESGD